MPRGGHKNPKGMWEYGTSCRPSSRETGLSTNERPKSFPPKLLIVGASSFGFLNFALENRLAPKQRGPF